MKCIDCGHEMAEHGYDATYGGRCPECLAAIVAALPMCNRLGSDGEVAQDAPILLGMMVYRRWYGKIEPIRVDSIELHGETASVRQWGKVVVDAAKTCNTREAAALLPE